MLLKCPIVSLSACVRQLRTTEYVQEQRQCTRRTESFHISTNRKVLADSLHFEAVTTRPPDEDSPRLRRMSSVTSQQEKVHVE